MLGLRFVRARLRITYRACAYIKVSSGNSQFDHSCEQQFFELFLPVLQNALLNGFRIWNMFIFGLSAFCLAVILWNQKYNLSTVYTSPVHKLTVSLCLFNTENIVDSEIIKEFY